MFMVRGVCIGIMCMSRWVYITIIMGMCIEVYILPAIKAHIAIIMVWDLGP
jgi:hypothetical protein